MSGSVKMKTREHHKNYVCTLLLRLKESRLCSVKKKEPKDNFLGTGSNKSGVEKHLEYNKLRFRTQYSATGNLEYCKPDSSDSVNRSRIASVTAASQLLPSSDFMTVKYSSLPENSDPEISGAVIFSSTLPVVPMRRFHIPQVKKADDHLKKPGPDPKCHNYGDMPLSKDEKDHILELHNKFRSSVALGKEKPQPPAGNMRQMSWDKELETIAERWADRCNSYSTDTPHDKCRRSKRFQVGQNVATFGSSAKPFSPDSHARTVEWFKEIKYFKPEWINSYRQHHEITEKTGHYAQFVWAESFLIGCARVIFEETVDNLTYTFDRLVCNYGPSGNVEGSPVYRSENPCLACPKSTSCSPLYKGLCASPEQIQEVIALKHELERDQPDELKKKPKTPALKTYHKNPSSSVKKPPINIMMKSPQLTKTENSHFSPRHHHSADLTNQRQSRLRSNTPLVYLRRWPYRYKYCTCPLLPLGSSATGITDTAAKFANAIFVIIIVYYNMN